jgi:hypothetical protein
MREKCNNIPIVSQTATDGNLVPLSETNKM